ncbi:MAG TPA: hypothetical protein VJZ71_05565 [Phycisphaerae bacterium]|nr:hypothetical protein [Phycisphaerae bacterium]
MRSDPCPSAEDLEALVVGTSSDPAIHEHMASCPRCSETLRTLHANAELVKDLRAADKAGVSAATRKRLLAICRHAAAEAMK